MKASVKLREEAKPLVRVKLPLNLLGVPFISGVSIGSGKEELAFHIGTLFDAGPSCRLSCRPNGAPSILFKAGLGPWGSPLEAAIVLAAEVSITNKGSPSISVHLRPKVGNFSLRRDAFSPAMIPGIVDASDSDSRLKMLCLAGKDAEHKRSPSPASSEGSSVVLVGGEEFDQNMLNKADLRDEQQMPKKLSLPAASRWRLVAHTGLPLGRQAVAKVRWQVRLPSDLFNEPDNLSLARLPVLVADKLSIETCTAGSPRPRRRRNGPLRPRGLPADEGGELGKVATVCSSIKRQLHLLYVENRMLGQTLEDLKADLGSRRRGLYSGANEVELLGPKDEKDFTQAGVPKQQEPQLAKADVAEQLKKAILTSSTASSDSKR